MEGGGVRKRLSQRKREIGEIGEHRQIKNQGRTKQNYEYQD